MKIVFYKGNAAKYESVKPGEVFSYLGSVYMRTNQPEEDANNEYMSVNLCSGEMDVFGREVPVTILDCELLIKS